MAYWICVTNDENWNIVKTSRIWGVPARRRPLMERVKVGDSLVFYVIPQRIMGIMRVISEPFESAQKVFRWGEFGREEVFPHRVKLEPVIVAKRPLFFREVLQKLEFVKNKQRYAWHLRKAMRIIPKGDYDLIRRYVETGISE